MVNYLARLGWSHGDDELFTARSPWPGSTAATWRSAAQWDAAKLRWVNAHASSRPDDDGRWRRWWRRNWRARRAGAGRRAALEAMLRAVQGPLRRGRAGRLAGMYFVDVTPREDWPARHRRGEAGAASALRERSGRDRLGQGHDRRRDQGDARRARPEDAAARAAVRVLVCGRAQTPSIDAVLALFPRETVLRRLRGSEIGLYSRSRLKHERHGPTAPNGV